MKLKMKINSNVIVFINENLSHTMPSYNETKLSTLHKPSFESSTNQHIFFVTFFFEQNKSHIMNNICSVEFLQKLFEFCKRR